MTTTLTQLVGQANVSGGQLNLVGGDVHGGINYYGPKDTSLQDALRKFEPPVVVRAQGFVGRDQAMRMLEVFYTQNPCGYFLIEASAGLGKSALAAKIALDQNAHAYFFEASAGVTRISDCLAHMCADLILRHKLGFEELPDRARTDSSLLVELLANVLARQPVQRLTLVLDALDEADDAPGAANPVMLPPRLPPGAYIVLTRRFGPTLDLAADTPLVEYQLTSEDPEQQADAATFIRTAVETRPRLAQALAKANPPVDPTAFVQALQSRSEGNFMYLSLVLADIETRKQGTPLDLTALPDRLTGYYEAFWEQIQRVADVEGGAEWSGLYEPTLQRLAVAAEPVTPAWLSAQVGRPRRDIERRVLARCSRVLRRIRRNGTTTTTWSVLHHSVADFLASQLDVPAAHLSIADRYLPAAGADWSGWDDYGLRYVAGHLAAAADNPPPGVNRNSLIDRLVALVTDPDFQATFGRKIDDPGEMWRQLNLGLHAATTDTAVGSLPLIANTARTMVRFRRKHLNPSEPFELAREGRLAAAQSRLELLATTELDPEWVLAVRLIIAWRAAESAPQEACALRDRVKSELPAHISPTLTTLAARVDAALEPGGTPPALAPLPGIPLHLAENLARETVGRLRGASFDSSLLNWAGQELMGVSAELMSRGPTDEDVGFLAVQDAPLLVTIARDAPKIGEPALSEYISVHRAYGYPQYRNPSLWHVLDAILRHPDAGWACTRAAETGAAALDPSEITVQEGLGMTALALKARAGATDAFAEVKTRFDAAIADADQMIAAAMAGQKHAGDGWGRRKRRLCLLAEVLGVALGRPDDALVAMDRAAALPFGYAGYHAPACLTLAETVQIVRPQDAPRINVALQAATESAHHVQSSVFCARTTARMNAIRLRWWPQVDNLPVVIDRLVRDPRNAHFAAVHVVGEDYGGPGRVGLPLDPELLGARSMEQLALAYRWPLASVLQMNSASGWQSTDKLADGTLVNMPDPGLPPLLAARLAAQAFADTTLSEVQRGSLIRALVPLAISNPTALDTVLSRLVLAMSPADPATLDSLQQTAVIEQNTSDASQEAVRPLIPG